MTSATSNDDTTREDTARLGKRKRKREKANDVLRSELEAFKREAVERVRGLEARVREMEARARETEARVEVAEMQRDAMRAELEEMRRTLEEEVNATRFGFELPLDVIAAHVLTADFLPDPVDVARFRAVSRKMRDAVDASGRELKEIEEVEAVEKGYLSTLKHMHSRGRLCSEESLCMVAAKNGQLAEIKKFRAKNFLWDESTCWCAAEGGHLDVLQWARANDCAWDKETCANAAKRGHLEVLKWAREKGCPWTKKTRRLAARKGYVES